MSSQAQDLPDHPLWLFQAQRFVGLYGQPVPAATPKPPDDAQGYRSTQAPHRPACHSRSPLQECSTVTAGLGFLALFRLMVLRITKSRNTSYRLLCWACALNCRMNSARNCANVWCVKASWAPFCAAQGGRTSPAWHRSDAP